MLIVGSKMAARMAITDTTTSNSIKLKARRDLMLKSSRQYAAVQLAFQIFDTAVNVVVGVCRR